VTPYSADAWGYGGIPRLVAALTRVLARRGHEVTICTTDACDATARLPGPTGAIARFGAWPPRRTPDGVDERVFPNLSNVLAYHLQLFVPLGLGRYLKRHVHDFDVAHLHACRNLPGAIAASHLRRAGVPYVLAPNGTAPLLERRIMAKRAFDLFAGRRVLGGASRVIAVSHAEERQLSTLGVAPSSIRLVPNPVDLDEFAVPRAAGRFRNRLGLRGPLLLFLGQLTPRKRVDDLLRAFANTQNSGATLVIAGNDMGARPSLHALAQSLKIQRRTVFTGLLRGIDRLDALTDADIVVYPSEHEIFGLVPLESLLCGTPVIVANDSGCGEIVRAVGGGEVIPARDVAALSSAIRRILTEPGRWRAAAAAAAVHVRATYDSAVVGEQLEIVYREMTEDA
jgi:glycosyltransferase involved in cell wall biosynthesis